MRLKQIYKNSFWLLLDKVGKLILGLYVTASLGKYLGPELFGIWSYAVALISILGVLAIFGLDRVTIKEIVNNSDSQEEIVGTVFFVRLLIGTITCLFGIGFVGFYKESSESNLYLYCASVLSLNLILQAFDVFDYYYQANNDLKNVIAPKVCAFIFFSVIKLICINHGVSLPTLAWLSFFELAVAYTIIVFIFSKRNSFSWLQKFNIHIAKRLLHQSLPLLVSAFATIIYMKVDQLMLDTMSSPFQLGQYAAAARISEILPAAQTVISLAVFPILVEIRKENLEKYRSNIELWLQSSIWLSIGISLFFCLFADFIIGLLYGPQYKEASIILSIQVWTIIPIFLGIAVSQYLLIEGEFKIMVYVTVMGCVINILSNMILIPIAGGKGAAISILLSQLSVIVVVVFVNDSVKQFVTMRILNPLILFQHIRTKLKII